MRLCLPAWEAGSLVLLGVAASGRRRRCGHGRGRVSSGCWALRPARKVRMPNWNWSSVEMRASSGASWTWWGKSPGGEGGEEGPHAADELVAGLRGGAGAGDLQGDEPQDVGEQGVDDPDHGLVGEARGRQDTVDRFAQAQAVGAKAGPLQREGDHGGVGEQVGADRAGEGGELLGPVAGGVGVQVQAGVDLVDEPVEQVGLAPDVGVEGGGTSNASTRRPGFCGPLGSWRSRSPGGSPRHSPARSTMPVRRWSAGWSLAWSSALASGWSPAACSTRGPGSPPPPLP
jgi:hypothetical protein